MISFPSPNAAASCYGFMVIATSLIIIPVRNARRSPSFARAASPIAADGPTTITRSPARTCGQCRASSWRSRDRSAMAVRLSWICRYKPVRRIARAAFCGRLGRVLFRGLPFQAEIGEFFALGQHFPRGTGVALDDLIQQLLCFLGHFLADAVALQSRLRRQLPAAMQIRITRRELLAYRAEHRLVLDQIRILQLHARQHKIVVGLPA